MPSRITPFARIASLGAIALAVSIASLLLLSACDRVELFDVDQPDAPATYVTATDYKVVILVVDGMRYTESFGDPTKQNVQKMWNDLAPSAAAYDNFRNEGPTVTMSGHAALVTGTWQSIANDGSERPHKPTLFEYYRSASGAPQTDAWIVGGKTKLGSLSYSTDSGYGSAYGASIEVGHSSDAETYDSLVTVLQTHQPHLVLASFSYVDVKGHSAVWDDYVGQITKTDTLVANVWQYLQSDPYYANATYLFITSDHGRHDDAHGGFANHGDTCEGCEHLTFLALGPDIQQGVSLDPVIVPTQRDVCTTVGDILGIDTPKSDGFPLFDIYVPVSTGIRPPPP